MNIKTGRWQNIKYAAKRGDYVTHYGTRLYLDEFLRREDYSEKSELPADSIGTMATSAFSGYSIAIQHDIEDKARVDYLWW